MITQNMYNGTTKVPQSGQKIKVSGRPTAPKVKTGRGQRIHNGLQPLLRQMPPTRMPSTPSMAKAAKEAREAEEAKRRAKARAKANSAKEKERICPRKRTGHQRSHRHRLELRRVSATTAVSTAIWAKTANTQTDAKLPEQQLADWRRPRANRAVPEVGRPSCPHRPREG